MLLLLSTAKNSLAHVQNTEFYKYYVNSKVSYGAEQIITALFVDLFVMLL